MTGPLALLQNNKSLYDNGKEPLFRVSWYLALFYFVMCNVIIGVGGGGGEIILLLP